MKISGPRTVPWAIPGRTDTIFDFLSMQLTNWVRFR